MDQHNISYFRNVWQKKMMDLEGCCKEWEEICCNSQIPDDVHGEIRTAIGLARLLMNQKLKQFKGLIDDSEFHTGEKEITCSDLQGFWDMVFYEIEKIEKSFERLHKCKNNCWKFVEEISEKYTKKVPVKRDISAFNKKKEIAKAQALAARQRFAELKKKMAASCRGDKDENQVDILLPNKKEHFENNAENVLNTTVLRDKIISIETNDKRRSSRQITSKKSLLAENSEESPGFKQKSAQKKKLTSNKENKFFDVPLNLKHSPAKQAKFNEPVIQELGKNKNKPDIMKLQCITRSAAKKALFQQNALQK